MNISDKFINFIKDNLPKVSSFHPYYNDMLGIMLLAGGKHFRAMLLLGIVNTLRKECLDDAMRVAFGVELMHTYSLIHDDLPAMDNADFRRAEVTIHKRYDEASAILAGDALNTHAFYEISRSNFSPEIRIKCVEILSQNAGVDGMVLGQAIDCYFENKKLDLEQLKFLHIHKTAKLIAASLKMGAVIAECDEKKCEKIYNVGLDLGLAFQVQDDIIDATGDENKVGKPVNSDKTKNSFTNLLGIDGAISTKNELIEKIKKALNNLPKGVDSVVLNLIDKYLR